MFARIDNNRIDDNPYQTRTVYGDLSDLTESLKELSAIMAHSGGLIHIPPARLVRNGAVLNWSDYGGLNATLAKFSDAHVELAAGHRRLRAFRKLAATPGGEAWRTFPVELGVFDDAAMADIAWTENEKRRDLSDVERALAIELAQRDFDWTQAEVGQRWNLSQSTVSNLLRLLRLPDKVRALIRDREITGRHGRALLPLVDLDARWEVYLDILQNGGPGQYRPVEAVESQVAAYLDRETYALAEVEYAEDWDPGLDGTRVCAECPKRIKVGREWRCTSSACFLAKQQEYRGPATASGVYAARDGWKSEYISAYVRCSGCNRTKEQLGDPRAAWLKSGYYYICPECAESAGLEPSPEAEPAQAAPVTVVTVPTVPAPANPVSGPAIPAPVARPTVPAPQPVYVRRADPVVDADDEEEAAVDDDSEDAATASPITAPSITAAMAARPVRAVVLTARIMPGAAGLLTRRVLVSIGEEGAGPTAFRQGEFNRIEWMLTEVLEAQFPELVQAVRDAN